MNTPICQIGDIVQYDWDPSDNILLVLDIELHAGAYNYRCLSLKTSRVAGWALTNGKAKVLA